MRSLLVILLALLLHESSMDSLVAAETLPVDSVITPITGDDFDLKLFPQPRQEQYTGRAVRMEQMEVSPQGESKLPAVQALHGFLQSRKLSGSGSGTIRIVKVEDLIAKRWGESADQGYLLTVREGERGAEITFAAHQAEGIFNALLTFQQLCHEKDGRWYVREATIEDWPAIRLRGVEVWRGEEAHYRENARLFAPYKMNAVWQAESSAAPAVPDGQQMAMLSAELTQVRYALKSVTEKRQESVEDLLREVDKEPSRKKKAGQDDSIKEATAKLANDPVKLAARQTELEKDIAELTARHNARTGQGEQAREEKFAFFRGLNIHPVLALRPTPDFASSPEYLSKLQAIYSSWHSLGVRNFVFDCDRTKADRGWMFKYGTAQAQLARQLQEFVKALGPDSRFYFWHQMCMGAPAGQDVDDFVQAGVPQDLQLIWIGKDIYTPRLTAADLAAYQAAFPGARAKLLLQLWPAGPVGEDLGPFPAHDPAVTRETNAFFLRFQIGRQTQQLAFLSALDWAWNPEAYDPERSMRVSAREWAKRAKHPAAAYHALSEMMEWLRTHNPAELHPEQLTIEPQTVQRLAEAHENIFASGFKTLQEEFGEESLAVEILGPAQTRIREFAKIAALRNRFQATPEEQKIGYVVFSQELFDYARPDEPPLRAWITDRMQGFGAPGQIVTVKFCVHALRDYAKVETDGCPLSGTSFTIDKQQVDLSVLRWHGKGSADTPSAEMLTKDDRVRLRGVLKETGLLPNVRLEGAVTTNLSQNQTKEFWIQVRIPADAPAGFYRGTVSVRLDQQTLKLPLALEVLSIKLNKPRDVLWGIWHPPAWTADKNWDDLTPEEQQQRPLTKDVFERYVKALGDCGFNTFTTPLWDDPRYLEVCRLMQKYGMQSTHNFANGMAWAYRDDGNPEDYRYESPALQRKFDLTEYTRAGIEFARKHKVPLPILSMEDETTALDTINRRTALMNAGGGEGWSCIHKNWHNMSQVLGWAIQNGGINRIDAAHAHHFGHFAAAYHQSYLGVNPGPGQRAQFGVGAWNNSADGFLPYTAMRYRDYPFDETKERDTFMTIYPTRYGPLLSTRYLGWREGVDDYRYIYTLQLLLDVNDRKFAEDPDKMNQLMLIRSALNHHLQQGLDSHWRRTLADWILQVQEM